MSAYVVSGSYLSDIADAIRAKTGTSDTMTIDEMPQKITDISGANFDNVNVTAADVLSPKIFIDKDGNEQFGTMPTNNLAIPSVQFNDGVFTSTVTQATGYVAQTTSSNSLTLPDSWTELNFEIIGNTTEPNNPKENTIWVNTEAPITSWGFSAEAPPRCSHTKNLIPYPYYQTTLTNSGVTFTDNGDGTITANGTATGSAGFYINHMTYANNLMRLSKGTYTLSGCPAGGSDTTYIITAVDDSTGNIFIDNGSGVTFTLDVDTDIRCTIWVAVPVSNVVFKPQLEKGAAATDFVKGDATGQVWITTGKASTGEFNALKKNGLMVYPLEAKQYVNGAWVAKTAKTYRGGAWVDWLNKLYSYGNVFTEVTGGWKGVKDAGGAFTFNSDNIYVGYSGGTKRDTAVYTVDKIDTTGYSKLKVYVNIESTQANYGFGFAIGLSTSNTSYSEGGFTATTERLDTGYATMSLDISKYQGLYYIKLHASVSKAYVYEVWLER